MVKDRIIEMSCKLFLRYGIKTTMDDVAKHLGVSKRTIYENFKDKTELLVECTEHMHELAYQQAIKIFENADNVLEAMLQLLNRQNTHGQQNFNFMVELAKYYPEIYKNHFLKCQEKRQGGVELFIRKGIDEGVFRSDINPLLTSFMFSEQANVIFSEQFQKLNSGSELLDSYSEFEVINNLAITYIRGISTTEGIRILENYLDNSMNKKT